MFIFRLFGMLSETKQRLVFELLFEGCHLVAIVICMAEIPDC